MVTTVVPWEIVEDTISPAPEEVIPEREQERLDQELYALVDLGAYDPENEVIE